MSSQTSVFLLLSIFLPVHGIFFGGGGCEYCAQSSNYGQAGGSYGDYSSQGYSGGYDQQQVGYAPQQNPINGKFIIRHKIYQPVIRRTTVELIPQQGTVSQAYRTEFVPDQSVSVVSANSGYEVNGGLGGQTYGSNYGAGAYNQGYGQGGYGNSGQGYGAVGSAFG